MPDDVKDGGASTATVEEVSIPIQDMTEPERATYLRDGTLPKREVKPTSDDGTKPPVESGAAPEAAVTQEPPNKEEEPPKRSSRSAERRIRNLNDEIKALRAQLAAKTETKPPEPSKPSTDTPSKAPKLKSFTDKIGAKDGYVDWDTAHEAYEDAVELHHQEQRAIAVRDALKAEQDKLDQAKAEELAKKDLTKHANAYADRVNAFRKTLPADDFNEMFVDVKDAIDDAMKQRPEMAEISNVLVESEVGELLTYYFGKHPDEFDALLEMPLRQALREIGKLEVSDKIKAPQPKTTTAAKRTTSNVTGRQIVPDDPLQTAIDKNDLVGYIAEANKAEGIQAPVRWGHR